MLGRKTTFMKKFEVFENGFQHIPTSCNFAFWMILNHHKIYWLYQEALGQHFIRLTA
jgi:hypothetical protein